jgi:ribonuclease HI
MSEFICRDCGKPFNLPQSVVDRYPGWVPRQCRSCRGAPAEKGGSSSKEGRAAFTPSDDPSTGVFTDGSSVPNPGPGGWGVVYVVDDRIISERSGHEADTTNNRMELTALLEALDVVPEGTPMTVYSDSNLAVRTITEWAEGWEKRGWKRKSGPVENLDLVKKVYAGYRKRPELELQWIKAHVGFRWNEYADRLAAKWREE